MSQVAARDAPSFARYRELAAASIARYGGRYLVRGGPITVAEGALAEGVGLVVVEFPSMAILQEWYRSPAYAEALAFRKTALERTLLFVEGYERPGSRPPD